MHRPTKPATPNAQPTATILRAGGEPWVKDCGYGDLPDRLRFLPWGTSQSVTKGSFTVGPTTLAVLPGNQERSNRKRVAIDFSHNSVEGSEFYRGEPVTLAGYGDVVVIEGDGLYLEKIDWTPEGRKQAANYRELSAAVLTNKEGEVIWMHSGAVARHGQVAGLALHPNATLAVAPAAALACLAFSPATPAASGGQQTSTTKDTHTTMDYKQILIALLGLGSTATEEQIIAAAEARANQDDARAAELATLSQSVADLQQVIEGAPASANITALAQRIADLEQADEANKRDALTREAIAQGKIIPLAADKLPLEHFRTLVESLPADQVPTSQRTVEGVKTLASTGLATHGADAAADAEVRRQLGLKPRGEAGNN